MTLKAGTILEGTIINITNFGAFVDVDGKTGLVHISEVADTFVKDIKDYLKEQDKVKVKVLSVDEGGKISLSIKQASVPQKHLNQWILTGIKALNQNKMETDMETDMEMEVEMEVEMEMEMELILKID